MIKIQFTFSPLPREIWTKRVDLSQAEFRLLGWLCLLLQFGKDQIKVADYQMMTGFTDGEGIRHPPVGLSKNSLKAARESLVKREFVVCEQTETGGGRGKQAGWLYSLNLSKPDQFDDNLSDSDPKPVKVSPETCQTLTLNLSDSDPVIRNIEKAEGADRADNSKAHSLPQEDLVVGSKEPLIPEWVEPSTWGDFVEMRKRIRAPLTDAAVKLSIRELTKLRAAGQDPNAVIEQSVMNSWRGLFPVKENGNHGQQQQTFDERRQQKTRANIVAGLGYGNREVPRPRGFAVENDAERGGGLLLEGRTGEVLGRKD